MGYIDPDSGTHFYDRTDPLSDTAIADVLNEAQMAEHNARLNDRARIESLENDTLQMHTIVPSAWITLNPGYSFQEGSVSVVRRMGPRIEFSVRVQRTSPLTHGGSIGYLRPEWRAIYPSEWQLVAHQSGGGQAAAAVAAVLEPDGDIIPLNPNGVSTILAVSGFYYMV